jgi:hypothetical protein
MPIYSAEQTGADFDGLTAATGLFDAAANTGGPAIQVNVNSVTFSGAGTITSWTLSIRDPSDGQTTVLLAETTLEFAAGGPQGFMLLPTNADGAPWQMTLVTTGLTGGPARFKIDFDFERTPG